MSAANNYLTTELWDVMLHPTTITTVAVSAASFIFIATVTKALRSQM